MEMINTVLENYPKTKSEFIVIKYFIIYGKFQEELGIETDEDNGFDFDAVLNY